jgi:Methyltransferase domain
MTSDLISSAQRDYVRRGRNRIPGWFYRVDAEIFALITDYQGRNSLDGSLVEIGLHHGKSFIAMCLSLREGEKAYGIDLFEEQQSLNLDYSGTGERRSVEKNLQAAGVSLSAVVLDGRSSTSVRPGDILGAVGAVRFFSIDGGHHLEVVRNDLALAEQTLAQHGVIALDDFHRPEWPEVSAGYFAWYAARSRPIVPFAIGLNKLYLCHEHQVSRYQEVLNGSEFLSFFHSKRYRFCGIELSVYQRFPSTDWTLKQRLVEYLKFYHPDVYVDCHRLRRRLLRRQPRRSRDSHGAINGEGL